MHIGMAAICQNPFDERSDGDVYRNELRLAALAEPLGFDSLWSVEHHFTDYTMVPDVLQFLSYFAGRTERIQLGSMVVVLPWHDPLRVAEQISMLDHVSNGRFILGMGRGAGRVEFEGFRLDMGESRERFVEAAQMVLGALETGSCEYARQVLPAAEGGDPAEAGAHVQGPHLRRGGVAGVDRDHGEARHRHPRDPAEAVGHDRRGARDLSQRISAA